MRSIRRGMRARGAASGARARRGSGFCARLGPSLAAWWSAGFLLASAVPGSAQLLPRDFILPAPLFAPDSPWNQTAASAAVLPESDQQILVLYRVLLGDSSGLHPPGTKVPSPFPFMFVNHAEYTIPVFRMGGAQQKVLMRDYNGTARQQTNPKLPVAPDGTVTVPAPVGTVRPSGPQSVSADGHLVLYDPATFTAYDFWNATTARDASGLSLGGGQPGATILEAGAIDVFDARGAGANPRTYSSARATGTPLLAGLLLPEDVERGVIGHALAFSILGPRNTNTANPSEPYPSDYFYPASTTETEFFNSNPRALAAGQRLRLKQTIVGTDGNPMNEATLAPITQMFLAALRTYGAYLVDNAGGLAFYAEDINTAVLHLTEDQVNALIGQSPGTPLPTGRTKWQVVIETLNQQLGTIPIAVGPPVGDPATATFDTSNFDVVGPTPATSTLFAAVLPSSRSVLVGVAATAFATIINASASTALDCAVAPLTTLPATFSYQTTDPATNQLTGTPNTPVAIPAGTAQSFVLALTPSSAIAPTEVVFNFDCSNTAPAASVVGVNTLLLSASMTPVADIVAMAVTPTNDGIVSIGGPAGIGAFSVAVANVGAGGAVTATADTGGVTLPLMLALCETNPTTGACVSPPAASVPTTINADATPTFAIFLTGVGAIPFDPAANRIFVRFRDAGGVIRGATSVAVRTTQ